MRVSLILISRSWRKALNFKTSKLPHQQNPTQTPQQRLEELTSKLETLLYSLTYVGVSNISISRKPLLTDRKLFPLPAATKVINAPTLSLEPTDLS